MTPPTWEASPPQHFDIVTGFFPLSNPKPGAEKLPRPMLVCGIGTRNESGEHFVRVAYGTKNTKNVEQDDLFIATMSALDALCLKYPTRFVLHSGKQMAILPWTAEFFKPWTTKKTPILSRLPIDMQKYVAYTLGGLDDLPQF